MNTVAYDTETTSLSRHVGEMFAYSTCDESGKTDVRRLDGSASRQAKSRVALDALWASKATKVMHNSKFDLGFTEKLLDRKLPETGWHDTYLMSHILRNDHPSHALKELSWELAGIPRDDESDVKAYTRGGGSYRDVPEHIMDKYQRRDAERTMLLYQFFAPKIFGDKTLAEVYEVERGVIVPTLEMENRGIMLNTQRCHAVIARLDQQCKEILNKVQRVLGDRITPSEGAFRTAFYRITGAPVLERTPTGLPSLDKRVLLELRKTNPHKLLELTLQYKSWSHGISTLQSYLDVADEEGVIHPNIHTCQAITGRESCSNPNLQNVEKDVGALKNPYPVPARSVFRPRPGHVNFHLDYSGIEMRLLIHYSGDEELVRICREGGDVHIPWAEVFYGDRFRNAVGAERDKLRDATKGADFGIGYGASAQTTSTTLGVSLQEGVRILAECRKRFPKMIGLMRKITGMVLSNGFVKTAFGRPLHVPRSQAYIGTNYLIQGTAAEILKRGQIAAHHYLKEATGGEVSLLLPIHDELIIEFPRKQLTEAPHVLGKVCKLMTGFPGRFNVPLGVSVSVATADWANKKKFEVA